MKNADEESKLLIGVFTFISLPKSVCKCRTLPAVKRTRNQLAYKKRCREVAAHDKADNLIFPKTAVQSFPAGPCM